MWYMKSRQQAVPVPNVDFDLHHHKVAYRWKAIVEQLLKGKRLVCLDIPDHYELMQPELITLLKERVPEYVRLSAVET